ncbi:MAG: tetratricopeptide repeat protein, partial [Myxococcota bacterium]|nr:tetratricopeptide repeat protein [Myxococcota bacterium]
RRVPLTDYRENLEAFARLGRDNDFTPVFVVVPNSPYARYPELFVDTPELAPRKDIRLWEQANRAWDAGHFEAAADLLERFVAKYPKLSGARFRLAQVYQQLGRFEDAHREFVRAGSQIIFTGYENTVRDVAVDEDVLLADLAPEFLEIREETLFVDDVHPNALGQELIAEEIYRQLLPQLEAERPGRKPADSRTP